MCQSFAGISQDQCRKSCRDDQGLLPFFCKSFHYHETMKLCLLSENAHEFPMKNEMMNSTGFSYYQATCIEAGNHTITNYLK